MDRRIRFADNLGRAFPNLQTLMLSNNQLVTLKELEPLAALKTLTQLSLVDNLVTKQKGYRTFVISLLPKLRVLDFQKVRHQEHHACCGRTASSRPRGPDSSPSRLWRRSGRQSARRRRGPPSGSGSKLPRRRQG